MKLSPMMEGVRMSRSTEKEGTSVFCLVDEAVPQFCFMFLENDSVHSAAGQAFER